MELKFPKAKKAQEKLSDSYFKEVCIMKSRIFWWN